MPFKQNINIDSSEDIMSNLILQINGRRGDELEANAELICEAANVAQATGLSPLQLRQRGDELCEALEKAKIELNRYKGVKATEIITEALSKHKTTTNDK